MKKILCLCVVLSWTISAWSQGVVNRPSLLVLAGNRAHDRQELDGEMDGLRAQISSALAAEFAVIDPGLVADAFRKTKADATAEEARDVEGSFFGGSAVRVAGMLNAEYVAGVMVTAVDRVRFPEHVTYRVRMSVQVLDAGTGGAVAGFQVTRQLPVRGADAEGEVFFREIFAGMAEDIAKKLTASKGTWARNAEQAAQGTLMVSSTVDELLGSLEVGEQVPEELQRQVQATVGGVTVWVNGAVVGSTPGEFALPNGLHTVRVTREGMRPWEAVVKVQGETPLQVALELSEDGLRRWQSVEGFRADLANSYAQAYLTRGIKINLDTANWQRVGIPEALILPLEEGN